MGTHEITGIKGANSNGVALSDLTVLPDGNKLMDAVISSNQVVGSIPQLAQAMAGFASGGGGADGLNPGPLGADTSKQQFLTTPQHT
jgi:hypothetical protein